MNAKDRYTERAARAAGEPMLGATDDARTDGLEPESRALESLVAFLQSARLPPSGERRDAVLRRLGREPKAPRGLWVGLIAASILVVIASVIATYSSRSRDMPSVLSPPGSISMAEPVFHEVFAPRTWEITDTPVAGPPPPAGASQDSPAFLRPFAKQAEFPLLVPTALPKGTQLMAARYRRNRPGSRPFSFLWLEYAGPEGRAIVLQTPDAPSAQEAIETLVLPRGWLSTSRTADGVRALVASPKLSRKALSELAGRLAPLID